MALRWLDSFDHYVTADIPEKYDSIGASPTIDGSVYRFGGGAMRCGDGNTQVHATKVLDSQGTWTIGFAFRYNMSGGDKEIIEWLDGATSQVTLRYQTSTRRIYLSGPGGTLGIEGGAGMSDNVWYYIEVKIVFGNSGTYEVRRDGNVLFSGTGDTQNSANASADRFKMRAGGSSGTSTGRWFDDLYVCDGTTGAGSNPCNTFLGDVRVECLRPNGNGASSQLVGQDADSTDNYLNVDDTAPDDDTTYNQSSTVGDKDTYALTDLTTPTGTVFGTQTLMHVRKDDAGTRSVKSVMRESGGSESDGAVKTLSTTYRYYTDIREVDPTAADWTIASINAAEAGMKVNA